MYPVLLYDGFSCFKFFFSRCLYMDASSGYQAQRGDLEVILCNMPTKIRWGDQVAFASYFYKYELQK